MDLEQYLQHVLHENQMLKMQMHNQQYGMGYGGHLFPYQRMQEHNGQRYPASQVDKQNPPVIVNRELDRPQNNAFLNIIPGQEYPNYGRLGEL